MITYSIFSAFLYNSHQKLGPKMYINSMFWNKHNLQEYTHRQIICIPRLMCIFEAHLEEACLFLMPKYRVQIFLYIYGRCSKIFNTSCLPKRPKRTVQTQIRLLLKKQSDQGLPCLLFPDQTAFEEAV